MGMMMGVMMMNGIEGVGGVREGVAGWRDLPGKRYDGARYEA